MARKRRTQIKKPKQKRLTKAEQIAKIPPEQIATLKGDIGKKVLENYVRTMRSSYKRRVASFNRNKVVSYAQIAFEKNLPAKWAEKKVKDMSRNQLILELARYSSFFNSSTSSLPGIKAVNYEQDARIFGTYANGKPLSTMSALQRKYYWDMYDEFMNANPALNISGTSEQVQKILASVVLHDKKFNSLVLAEQLEYIKAKFEIMKQEQEEEELQITGGKGNVYSGKGPNK